MQINICKIFISTKCSSPATTNPAASNLQMQCYVNAFSSLRKDYFAQKRVKYFNNYINWMRNICMFKIKLEDDTVKYFFGIIILLWMLIEWLPNLTVKVIQVGTGYCVYWIVSYMYFVSFSLHPLFPGSNEVDQIAKIHDIMGTPDSSVLDKLKKWVLLQLLNSFFYSIFQSSLLACYLWLLVHKS